jgi:hypothetical protein
VWEALGSSTGGVFGSNDEEGSLKQAITKLNDTLYYGFNNNMDSWDALSELIRFTSDGLSNARELANRDQTKADLARTLANAESTWNNGVRAYQNALQKYVYF